MDCGPPNFQARILELVAISFFRNMIVVREKRNRKPRSS